MRVDVVYDFLCPWCHVAKRHLKLALEADATEEIAAPEIRWHQFMLYPHFDRGGHDFLEFFKSKYGDALRVPMWDQIRSVAGPIGIDFVFEKMTRGPASIDGHRLVRWAEAQRPGVSAAMIEDIATSFFEEAKVIDIDFLIALASDADLEAPFRETDEWRAKGVVSMPHYIVQATDGTTEVIRQTSVEAFRTAFARARRSIAA